MKNDFSAHCQHCGQAKWLPHVYANTIDRLTNLQLRIKTVLNEKWILTMADQKRWQTLLRKALEESESTPVKEPKDDP